jgi:ABC-2 type transport system permease protein
MKESTATATRGLLRDSAPSPSRTAPAAAPLGKNIYTIALRELRAYFDSLVAYVVLGGSLFGLGIYFFLFQGGGFWQVDRATMTRMFEFLPWALALLVIPLITMRALAEEKRSGTIELLITLPVTDADVILGKYFAALAMAAILLLATLIYPIAMFVWPWHLGSLDWGPVWSGYVGLFLFSTAGIALGLLFSSLT